MVMDGALYIGVGPNFYWFSRSQISFLNFFSFTRTKKWDNLKCLVMSVLWLLGFGYMVFELPNLEGKPFHGA